MRRSVVLLALLGLLVIGWHYWGNLASQGRPGKSAAAVIEKLPINFANRTFDPENPPSDMPPIVPGELAVCDSNFIAKADVSGDAQRTGATHALVTVTGVKVTLQLHITIWVPANASQHVIEHEQGHREISEYFYKTADKIAERIAAGYIGKQESINGPDLNDEVTKSLQQMGAEITEQYGKELNPEPAQLRYDEITDHSRNEVEAEDAVSQALKDDAVSSTMGPARVFAIDHVERPSGN